MLTDPSFQKRPSKWMAVSAHLRRGEQGGSTGNRLAGGGFEMGRWDAGRRGGRKEAGYGYGMARQGKQGTTAPQGKGEDPDLLQGGRIR